MTHVDPRTATSEGNAADAVIESSPTRGHADERLTEPPPEPPHRSWLRRKAGHYVERLNTAGILFAVLLAWASLTPSLLPRVWAIQGVFTGLCLISGYGIGIVVGWILEIAGLTEMVTPLFRRIMRASICAATILGTVVGLYLSSGWQNEVRVLLDMPPAARWPFIGVPVVALILAWIILTIARTLRWVSLKITALIALKLPPRLSRLIAVVIVGWFVVSIASGFLWNSILDGLNGAFSIINASFDDDVAAPTHAERSGSPASYASWESLGLQGRRFVAGGASIEQLAGFHTARITNDTEAVLAHPETAVGDVSEVREPIRVYAGLDGRSDLDEIAADVVRELDRTNAWDRKVLVVATTTGTGWVDSSMSDALELMHGGDTAIAAMQYSNLPSWLSFIGDQSTPPAAGRALFEAVYEAWSVQPEATRPKLIVFGISLGAFGTQGAFRSAQDIAARTDGALLVGSPGFAPMWRDITDRRDPGSFEHAPVYQDGRTVRFMTGPAGSDGDPAELSGPWKAPRIIFAQHASDGVTWWSPSLLWSQPDWLTEERGRDVHPNMRWFPVVTFWQLTSDLFFSAADDVPMGHGHHYELEYSDGLALIVPPEDWDDEDTQFLRTVIANRVALAQAAE